MTDVPTFTYIPEVGCQLLNAMSIINDNEDEEKPIIDKIATEYDKNTSAFLLWKQILLMSLKTSSDFVSLLKKKLKLN